MITVFKVLALILDFFFFKYELGKHVYFLKACIILRLNIWLEQQTGIIFLKKVDIILQEKV